MRYVHDGYDYFHISDPKARDIHKASVRDRIVHHAVYRALYPYFDRKFIHDSYSCRENKGTHRAMRRFAAFAGKESLNHTRTAWVLKCDVRKFFANIDHEVLLEMLRKRVSDARLMAVLEEIIRSFPPDGGLRGIPLGNLTSQLFANIYMHPLDHFVKRTLCVKHYIRYADDFVVLSASKDYLFEIFPRIAAFLRGELGLVLHEEEPSLSTVASGIDFLGWVHFPDHRVIRRKTSRKVKRLLARASLGTPPREGTVASYLGLLKHGNARTIQKELLGLEMESEL